MRVRRIIVKIEGRETGVGSFVKGRDNSDVFIGIDLSF